MTAHSIPVFSWTVWSGIAIAVSAIFAAWLTRRTKISEFRQAWIIDLRKDIADYIGASERWIHKWEEMNCFQVNQAEGKRRAVEAFAVANEARVILYRIQLRFNPRENKHKAGDDAFLSSLEDLLNPKKLVPDQLDSSWHDLALKSVNMGRELLKREWEVTKGWIATVMRFSTLCLFGIVGWFKRMKTGKISSK